MNHGSVFYPVRTGVECNTPLVRDETKIKGKPDALKTISICKKCPTLDVPIFLSASFSDKFPYFIDCFLIWNLCEDFSRKVCLCEKISHGMLADNNSLLFLLFRLKRIILAFYGEEFNNRTIIIIIMIGWSSSICSINWSNGTSWICVSKACSIWLILISYGWSLNVIYLLLYGSQFQVLFRRKFNGNRITIFVNILLIRWSPHFTRTILYNDGNDVNGINNVNDSSNMIWTHGT